MLEKLGRVFVVIMLSLAMVTFYSTSKITFADGKIVKTVQTDDEGSNDDEGSSGDEGSSEEGTH